MALIYIHYRIHSSTICIYISQVYTTNTIKVRIHDEIINHNLMKRITTSLWRLKSFPAFCPSKNQCQKEKEKKIFCPNEKEIRSQVSNLNGCWNIIFPNSTWKTPGALRSLYACYDAQSRELGTVCAIYLEPWTLY